MVLLVIEGLMHYIFEVMHFRVQAGITRSEQEQKKRSVLQTKTETVNMSVNNGRQLLMLWFSVS